MSRLDEMTARPRSIGKAKVRLVPLVASSTTLVYSAYSSPRATASSPPRMPELSRFQRNTPSRE